MVDESDGIEEALETTVRLAVMAGARLGSEIARAREDRLREQRRVDEREADRLAQRFEAEKRAAVAELSQVHRSDWWERADAERIGQAYATARAWPAEPAAAAAELRLHEEVRSRYGVDTDVFLARVAAARAAEAAEPTFTVDEFRNEAFGSRMISKEKALRVLDILPTDQPLDKLPRDVTKELVVSVPEIALFEGHKAVSLSEWVGKDLDVDEIIARKFPRELTQEQLDRITAQTRDRGRQERVLAAVLVAEAEAEGDRSSEPVYDSADRRAAEVRRLEAKGIDSEVARNRMYADTAVGKPATLATVSARRGRAPKARKGVGRGAQVERTGIER